jgi:choline-sulfatase
MSKPTNLLFILSDQHTRDITGCYGHPVVQTPNLDRLAEQGTRFTNAYTNSPLCVPARAVLATGRYVYQTGHWDNAFPYHGEPASWGHRLKAQGYQIDSIGKLHFRSPNDDNGFSREIEPLHVVEGIGDLLGSIRHDPPLRNKRPGLVEAGPGDSTYLRYDARNADNTCRWLAEHANDDKPWVLFASFVCPHPPYIAPEELYNLYPPDRLPLPPQWQQKDWPQHPALDYLRHFFNIIEPLDEAIIRRVTAAYYGLCTYLDKQIGRVLQAAKEYSLSDTTRIIYTSDHGESLGARGLFGKFTLYDEAAAIPFILAGPDVPQSKVVKTPISLVDCFPTILEAVGASLDPDDENLPGQSLWPIAQGSDQTRTVFSEYHGIGSENAAYMLRDITYKYIYYVDAPPQLFNLERDLEERNNLAPQQDHQAVVQDFENRLRTILDPEKVDTQAKTDQRDKVETFGGEEAVRKRGFFVNSPTPGEAPAFQTH